MSVEAIWSKLELTLPGALNGRRPGAEYFLSQICGLVHLKSFKFIFTKHDLNMQNFRTFSRRTSACFLGWEISRHSGLKPLQLTGVTFDQVKADSAERALGSAWLRSLLSFCSFWIFWNMSSQYSDRFRYQFFLPFSMGKSPFSMGKSTINHHFQ